MVHAGMECLFRIAATALLLIPATFPCSAADPPEATIPGHLVITERKLDHLERRIGQYASRGYRYLGASEGRAAMFKSASLSLHLALPGDSEEARSYKIEAGVYSDALEKRLNRAAAVGYRVRPDGILKRVTPNPLAERAEEKIVFILERDGRGPPREYRLLDAGGPKQFRQRIGKSLSQGFRITGMRAFYRGWILLVLERSVTEQLPTEPPGGADGYYRLIDETKRGRLFERMEAAISEGYRVISATAGASVGGGHVVLLERIASPERRYAYWSLNRTPTADLESRLNQGGSAGYRFRPRIRPPFDLLMERAPGDERRVAYRVITSRSSAEIGDLFSRAEADGFVFAGMYEEALVLERLDAATRP